MGRSDRYLENVLEDTLRFAKGGEGEDGLMGTKIKDSEVIIVHNVKTKMQTNFILDIIGYWIYYSWVPWSGSAEVAVISKADLEAFIGGSVFSGQNNGNSTAPSSDPNFNDIVVLKNGEILEGVKTTVTAKELIVTDSKGNTTVYQKKEVLSVRKKK